MTTLTHSPYSLSSSGSHSTLQFFTIPEIGSGSKVTPLKIFYLINKSYLISIILLCS